MTTVWNFSQICYHHLSKRYSEKLTDGMVFCCCTTGDDFHIKVEYLSTVYKRVRFALRLTFNLSCYIVRCDLIGIFEVSNDC